MGGVRSWRARSSSVTTLKSLQDQINICQRGTVQKIKQVGRTQALASQNALQPECWSRTAPLYFELTF